MLKTWPLSGFLSPKHGQNFSQEETTPPPAHTSPQIMSQYQKNTSNIPRQQNQSKKAKHPFLVSNSYLHPFGSCCPCPTRRRLGLQGGQVQHGERSPDSPSPALGYPLLWSGSFAWKRQGSPEYAAESMAKTVMQNMDVSFLLGKKLTNVEMFHVENVGCKWKCLGFWKEETKLVTRTSHMSQCSSLCVHL